MYPPGTLREWLENKTKKKVDIISPLPGKTEAKKEGGGGGGDDKKKTEEKKGGDDKKKEVRALTCAVRTHSLSFCVYILSWLALARCLSCFVLVSI